MQDFSSKIEIATKEILKPAIHKFITKIQNDVDKITVEISEFLKPYFYMNIPESAICGLVHPVLEIQSKDIAPDYQIQAMPEWYAYYFHKDGTTSDIMGNDLDNYYNLLVKVNKEFTDKNNILINLYAVRSSIHKKLIFSYIDKNKMADKFSIMGLKVFGQNPLTLIE